MVEKAKNKKANNTAFLEGLQNVKKYRGHDFHLIHIQLAYLAYGKEN